MSLERSTAGRLSFTRFSRKLSLRNKEYSKVEDSNDTRIPVHNEDAFQYGLRFKAKYIGGLEIAKPTSKIDIITAMRRIRYEYKVKGLRKSRCYVEMSVSGVKVTKRKRRRSRKKYSAEQLFIMQHPIYRIFYVSHDSQDMKIFSYITREVPDNTFRCNVFKAYKKSMALHIVRSLGQAFDICHKLNPKPIKKKTETNGEEGDKEEDAKSAPRQADGEEEVSNGDAKPADSSTQTGVPAHWKTFNTDLDEAMGQLSVGDIAQQNGVDADNKQKKIKVNGDAKQDDFLGLNFDPFATNVSPLGNSFVQNGSVVVADPFQSSFTSSGDSGAVSYPPLTIGGQRNSLPDFPAGVDPAKIKIPPPHMAYFAGLEQQQRASSTSGQQGTITENPFTSHIGQDETPISLGESLSVIPENKTVNGHQRKSSNPFGTSEDTQSNQWMIEKKQFMMEMSQMREDLKLERAARLQSQQRVEHLLSQNKDLLDHLQMLMSQLSQLQTLQISLTQPKSDNESKRAQTHSSPPPDTTSSNPPAQPATKKIPLPESSEQTEISRPSTTTSADLPKDPSTISPAPFSLVSSSPSSFLNGDTSLTPTMTSTPSPTPTPSLPMESAKMSPSLPVEPVESYKDTPAQVSPSLPVESAESYKDTPAQVSPSLPVESAESSKDTPAQVSPSLPVESAKLYKDSDVRETTQINSTGTSSTTLNDNGESNEGIKIGFPINDEGNNDGLGVVGTLDIDIDGLTTTAATTDEDLFTASFPNTADTAYLTEM